MKRWIVNAAERTVRPENGGTSLAAMLNDKLKLGEFYWTGTYADAMAAGARRRLAEEALSRIEPGEARALYVLVADRIEPQASGPEAVYMMKGLAVELEVSCFDVWREGTGLVVLGRLSG